MGGWRWKDLGIRPLVFPVLALGIGSAVPGLVRAWPALAACLELEHDAAAGHN